MTAKIIDIDRGYRGFFTRAIATANQKLVTTVGVQGAKADEDHGGITNARLAGVHEFGAIIKITRGEIAIPERSFIRATIDKKDLYKNEIRALATKVLQGAFDAGTALRVLGEKISSDIKATIEHGIDPPNAASTIARKGSSKPLIDTGELKNSITYDVRPDHEGESIAGNR